jgi:hypothetical protein
MARCTGLLLAAGLSGLLGSTGASGQESGIGYPSVSAALQALKARADVKISIQGAWTIVQVPSENALWSFTPAGHPAHPAAVKRTVVEKEGKVFINMQALCQAAKDACDKLIAEFDELNNRMRADIQRRLKGDQAQWAPSEEQKKRAEATLARLQRAMDEGRHRDAYEMLTPGMKGLMSFDQFVSFEKAFQQQSGGEGSRTETRVTWYKDPPNAAAPGVYAAFDIRCTYRNINICSEVVILHEQDNGEFLVMRRERNFVDKDNEQKLRDRQDKGKAL